MPSALTNTKIVIPVALIIFGAKLLLIQRYGSIAPFGDQWDGEANDIFIPFINGTLSWANLLKPHNEHRILFTRLLDMALLASTGVWLVPLQLVANACIHMIVITGILYVATAGIKESVHKIFAALSSLAIFCIPYGWENSLWGFQSQFYFVAGFSLVAVLLLGTSRPFSAPWAAGLLSAVAAYFSMASGLLALPAALLVIVWRWLGERRMPSGREILGAAVIATLLLLEHQLMFRPPHQQDLAAHSLSEFVAALVGVASWPFPSPFGLLMYVPLAGIAATQIWPLRNSASRHGWIYICFGAWILTQWAAIAYARPAGSMSSRYMDIITLGPVLAIYSTIHFGERLSSYGAVPARLAGTLSLVFAACILAAGVVASKPAFQGAHHRGAIYKNHVATLRKYIATQDVAILQRQFPGETPYRAPERLASLVDNPAIRAILPTGLTDKPERPDKFLPSWFSLTVRFILTTLLQSGQFFVGFGVGLALAFWGNWALQPIRIKISRSQPLRTAVPASQD